jgi:hypothetical protein
MNRASISPVSGTSPCNGICLTNQSASKQIVSPVSRSLAAARHKPFSHTFQLVDQPHRIERHQDWSGPLAGERELNVHRTPHRRLRRPRFVPATTHAIAAARSSVDPKRFGCERRIKRY